MASTPDYRLDDLPDWNADALAAIGASLLRSGELEKGRRVLQQVRAFKPKVSDDQGYSMKTPPWALAISASAEGGDIAGAIADLKHLQESSDRSLGLTLIGEAQAESGDDDAAWNTFQAAVTESGIPGESMDATSLSDIGLGAAQSRKVAAARLISTRVGSSWLTQCLEKALPNGLSLGNSLTNLWEIDPAWELRHKARRRQFSHNLNLAPVEESAADALNFWEAGRHVEAESKFCQAEEFIHRLGDPYNRSNAWFSVMSAYLAIKNWPCAVDCAEKIPDLTRASNAFHLITKFQVRQGDIADALDTVECAEEFMRNVGPGDYSVNGSRIDIYMTIAAAVSRDTQSDLAMAYFAKAWQSASEKVHPLIHWTRTERQNQVVVAIAKAGYIREAINRYKEAGSERE